MQYAEAIRTILSNSATPMTPQLISDQIRLNYPNLYNSSSAIKTVSKGHSPDLHSAMVSRIYSAIASSPLYIIDRTVEPILVRLSSVIPKAPKHINPFFTNVLNIKLVHSRQSWGAYDQIRDLVVLRVWQDQIFESNGKDRINVLLVANQSDKFGYTERTKHLELMNDGVPGYAIICTSKNVEDKREIHSFNDKYIFKLGLPVNTGDSISCEIEDEIPLSKFLLESEKRSINAKISNLLSNNSIYTREELKLIIGTQDASIRNGVFHPRGFASVCLFVTEDKSKDRTQYIDFLDGDTLQWQGQQQGRTDALIIDHAKNSLELLLFYRKERYEHPGGGFEYIGQFSYVQSSGKHPTSFVLQRVKSDLEKIAEDLEAGAEFDVKNSTDGRKKILASVVRRQGQRAFRKNLLVAYEGACAVTECRIEEILEAAHIMPYRGAHTNHVTNGVLLRADIHTLFDLKMIRIDPVSLMIVVDPKLSSSEYGRYNGNYLRLPKILSARPSADALLAAFNAEDE